jgi:DNA helicase HerA-like ATPase
MQDYGTVISTFEGPSSRKFSFVINQDIIVRRGQFVQLDTEDGKLIGRVSDVIKTNRYFMRPESVKEYESHGSTMNEIFPSEDWEYLVANVNALGIAQDNTFSPSTFPPSPGTKVSEPDEAVLEKFFGFDGKGIHLGDLQHHKVPVKLNATRLLQKHMAILAISGAGKSFLSAVLIEELLSRKPEEGQLAIIVIDTHGEYTSFAEDPAYAHMTKVFPVGDIQIGLPNLGDHIGEFLPELSGVQLRELKKVMHGMKDKHYGLPDLAKAVEENEGVKTATKEILATTLDELRRHGIFGVADYPHIDELARQGGLSVIDLSKTTNLHTKQMVAAYIARKLFRLRCSGSIPPFLLVLEEAHQFITETAKGENAISRSVFQTIAREGRKFHASLCLISQRPIQLSTTVLSQCNTHIILRVTNPYDLDHIGKSSEGINKSVLGQISSLKVGNGLIVGEAVNTPVFVKIRARSSKESRHSISLEKAAFEYYKNVKQKMKDTEAFV